LVFGSVDIFDSPGFASRLTAAYPGAITVGCSTAGEIAGDSVLDGSCVATAIRFGKGTAVTATEAGIASADDSQRAGEASGEAPTARPDPPGGLPFARGVSYGEIGPMRDPVDHRLHNQTMAVALLTKR
jgi:hypothetical protein